MGFFGLGVLFAPAVGPTVGGYLVEYVNWRLIFYINIPVAVLGVVAAAAVLPRFPRKGGQRFDGAGFATVATGSSPCCWRCPRAPPGDGGRTAC